jgi:hypothetical protein
MGQLSPCARHITHHIRVVYRFSPRHPAHTVPATCSTSSRKRKVGRRWESTGFDPGPRERDASARMRKLQAFAWPPSTGLTDCWCTRTHLPHLYPPPWPSRHACR